MDKEFCQIVKIIWQIARYNVTLHSQRPDVAPDGPSAAALRLAANAISPIMMKRTLLLLLILVSAITADAQKLVERPRFADNWSISVAGGVYHPMFYDLKYLVQCSGYAGSVELKKQLTPVFGFGIEGNGYYRLYHKERKDPRTVIGPVVHINLMNLFGGYKGAPRVFEIDASIMPAWGHLYRGTGYAIIPDENYFTTKYGLDLNFNVGRKKAWTISLKPAMVCDVLSRRPIPGEIVYTGDGYTLRNSDIQLFAGFTYHFRNHDGSRHTPYAAPATDNDEVDRLNEIVNFLRQDVEQRDLKIKEMQQEIDSLRVPQER